MFLSGEEVRLTRTEFDLLAELAARRAEALPHVNVRGVGYRLNVP